MIVVAPGLGEPADGATVALRQNPRTPQDIALDTGGRPILVTMVATPDEWNLIGGYPEPAGTAAATPVRR